MKQFDYDGTVTKSDVIYLEGKVDGVNIFPKPVAKGNQFVVNSEEKINGVEIRNSLGALVYQRDQLQTNSLVIESVSLAVNLSFINFATIVGFCYLNSSHIYHNIYTFLSSLSQYS